MRELLVWAGAAVSVAGSGAYVRDTLRGTTLPNRATFTLWAIAPLIAFAAEVAHGVGVASLTTFIAGFTPLLIVAASYAGPGAPWRLGLFDYTCAALSAAALVLWWITGSGDVAILLSILADLLAALPTLVKAWRHPHTETASAYVCAAVNGACGALAAGSTSFAALAFPIYLVLIGAGTALILTVPRR